LRFGPGDLDQKPLPEHTLAGEFAFEDLSVRYLESMPPVLGVGGRATFTGQRMDFQVQSGHVGDLVVDHGSVVITGIGIPGREATQLEVMTQVRGPVAQALDLIDQPPLGFASELGIEPAAAGGQVTTDLRIGMPLHREVFEPSEVRVKAEAAIADGALAGRPVNLRNGQLTLVADNQGVNLAGTAIVEEVPLTLDLRENFGPAAFERRYHIKGTPEIEALRRLGLDLPLVAEGAVGIDARITEARGSHAIELALDLAPLALEVQELGWRKAAGAPGALEAALVIVRNGPIEVTSFRLTGPDLDAEGSLLARSAPFRLERLQLDRLQLGVSDARITVRTDAGTGYDVEIAARTLDLTPILNSETGDAPPPELRLRLQTDRLLLEGGELRQVSGDLAQNHDGWRQAEATGLLADGGEFRLDLVPDGDRRRLRFTTADAGGLLRTLNETNRIEGGQLVLEATISQQRPTLSAEGRLEITEFRVQDAPILARLLTLASPTGIGDILGGEGLWLDKLEAPFALAQRQLDLGKGRMYGSQLGLTFQGRVDLDADRLDLDGTVVPLYGINWTIGQIPVIGNFLRGEEGEGAFAATYQVSGPIAAPSVSVNPLSALAPGFLRELLSGLRSGTLEPPDRLPSYDK
jgi:uncharacterized protein YhdP